MRLEDFRKQYPQYNDISDEDLARGLHRRFYSDIPFEDFSQRIGFGPESGDVFVPALKSGVSLAQEAGYALAGRTGLMDEAAAQKAIEEEQAYQQRVFKPTEEGFLEAPVTKTLELLGQSLPFMALPVAAAGAALTLPFTGPAATVAALGAAGLASGAQFTGTNLLRQMEPTEDNPRGKSIGETDLGNAALAAVPQAALDVVSFRMMPFIRGVFGQAGKTLTEKEAQLIASKALKDVAADYALATGKTMTVEGLTEAAQQSLERLQAGLNITDQAARDEYLESFIGGAVLGGVLAPPGRYLERRAAQQAQQPEAEPQTEPTPPPAGVPPGAVIPEEEALTPEEEAEFQARLAAAPPAAPVAVQPQPQPPLPPAPAAVQPPVTPAPVEQVVEEEEVIEVPPTVEQIAQQAPATPQTKSLTDQLAQVRAARMDPMLTPEDPAFQELDRREQEILGQIEQLSVQPGQLAPSVQAGQLPPPAEPSVQVGQLPQPSFGDIFTEPVTPTGQTVEDQIRAQKAEERRERQAAQEAKKGEFVLQNRDRSSTASLEQMEKIASEPDYGRAGFSRTPDGAPIIAYGDFAPEQLGREDVVTTARGRKIPIQYAVVEADEVITSNDMRGTPDTRYGNKEVPGPRAIAGNGRITGLQEAFNRGTATPYVEQMEGDASLHGVSPDVIASMKKPILVRVMPQEGLTRDIGDELNMSSMLELSPVEQARNDLNRVDLEALEFGEDGEVTNASLGQFINAQPIEERAKLVDRGLPTKQARQRLENAIFAQAYNDDDLIAMFAQTDDPEAKLVVNALAQVAPQMAQLEGAGDLDIRDIVTDAAKIIISGKRRGLKMREIATQVDMTVDPDTRIIVELFAANPRSNKGAIEALRNAATTAYNESLRPEEGLFGVEPKMERREIVERMRRGDEPTRTEDVAAAQRPGPAPSDVERQAEPSPAAVPPQDQGFELRGQTPEELAELRRKELSGEAEAERDRIEAQEAAKAAEIAAKRVAEQKGEQPGDLAPTTGKMELSAPPITDLFGTQGITDQPVRGPRRVAAEPSPIEKLAAEQPVVDREYAQNALAEYVETFRDKLPNTGPRSYEVKTNTVTEVLNTQDEITMPRADFDALVSIATTSDSAAGIKYSIVVEDTPEKNSILTFRPRSLKATDQQVNVFVQLEETNRYVEELTLDEDIKKSLKGFGLDDRAKASKKRQEEFGISKPVADALVRADIERMEMGSKLEYGVATEAEYKAASKKYYDLLKKAEEISRKSKVEEKEEKPSIPVKKKPEAKKEEKPKDDEADIQFMLKGTEDQQKGVRAVAETLGGTPVYFDPDTNVGLVRGYGLLSGKPVYAMTMGDRYSTADVEESTVSLFAPYKAQLIEVKKRLEKEAEQKHKDDPFITFDKGIAMSDGIDSSFREIITEWKSMLGLGNVNIYFSTIEDAKKNLDNFTGPHRVVGSGTLDANEGGSVRRMPDGSYYVLFKKSTSKTSMLETIAHELGHVHEREAYQNAPQELKDKLKEAHAKWVQERKGKTAREAVEMLRAKTSAQTTKIAPGKDQAAQLSPYWSSFSEWYADQVSRWAVTDEKPVGVVEKFFARLGAALRRFYQTLKGQKYLPDETFVQYLNQVKPVIVEEIPGPIKDPVQIEMSFQMQKDLFGSTQEAKEIEQVMEVKGKKKLPPGRSPELTAAAQAVQAGTMTAEEYNKLVDIYKPIPLYEEPLKPATSEQVFDALDVKKREQINPEIPNGTKVGLRLDIPAFNRKGVFVVSIHQKRTASAPGKVIGYGSVAKAKNVTFGLGNQLKALEIAAGSAKDALQTMEGDYVNVTSEQAFAEAQRAIKDPNYVQIGIDPTRHAYFYDRRTTLPVVAAEEVIQIGNMILAKKPTFGSKADFLYNIDASEVAGDTQPADMSFLDRLRKEDSAKRDQERNENIAYYASIRRKQAELMKQVAQYGSTLDIQRQLTNLNEIAKTLKEDIDLDRQPTYSAENFMRQARAALDGTAPYKEQAIDPDVFAVIQAVYMDDPKLLEGLRLSIKPEFNARDEELRKAFGLKASAGAFETTRRIVHLYTGTKGVREPSTIRHELVHTLEQMMTGKQRQAVINSYLNALQKAIRQNKDPKAQKFFENVLAFHNNPSEKAAKEVERSLPSLDLYQFVNASEYWAVNAEKLMAQRLGVPWDRFKKAVRKIFQKLKSFFGFDDGFAVHEVFDQIMSGSKKRLDRESLAAYMGAGNGEFTFLKNIQEETDLMIKSGRADTPMLDHAPAKRLLFKGVQMAKDEYRFMVENPSSALGMFFNSVNRGISHLRNKFVWFGTGLNEADRIRYNGEIRTANGEATASLALDNMIRGGNISTQVLFLGGLEYNPKTLQYTAVRKEKNMTKAYEAEARLKEKLGDQLGTNIFNAYGEAKRSLSMKNEVVDRKKDYEQAEKELDEAEAIFEQMKKDPNVTEEEIEKFNRELRKLFIKYRDARKSYFDMVKLVEEKVTMPEDQIKEFIALENKHPELKEILDNFNAVNQNLLRVWRDVGLISEGRYKVLSSIKDYVPWYRIMNDDADIHDPVQSTTRTATNIGREKLFRSGTPSVTSDFIIEEEQKSFRVPPGRVNTVKLGNTRLRPNQYEVTPQGELTLKVDYQPGQVLVVETQREIENMIDNMTRNIMRMSMNAMRKHAANRIVSEYAMRDANGRIMTFKKADVDKGRMDYIQNGRRTVIEIPDPLIAQAMLGMETVGMDMVWEPLAAAANFTRRTITLSPVFQLKQVFKDAPTAALVTGVKNPGALIGGVYKGFIDAVRDTDPAGGILRSAGIGGFYSPARTPEADVKRQIGIINNNTFDYVMKALDHWGDSSDMAQRIAIYNRVMKETGDEALAMYQASNVINFLRHGSGSVAIALTRTVPFLNAYAQSIDVLYNALIGGGLRGMDRTKALRRLAFTGSLMAGTVILYTMLVGDDDDYQKLDDQTKVRNIIIPGTDVILPMNTSAAFFFKAIPELITNKIINEGTKNEVDAARLRTALKESAIDLLLGPTPVPSVAKPFIEISLDYNFFTSRPITPRGMENLDAYQQYDMRTSEAAKLLSGLTGTEANRLLNPMEADHLVRSIFGTAGAMVAWSSNVIGEGAAYRPEMTIKEFPVVGAFLRPEVPRGREDLFYRLKDATDRKYKTYMTLVERGDDAEADRYFKRHPNLISYYEYTTQMANDLKEINKVIRFIAEVKDPSYSAERKRTEIQELMVLKQEVLEGIEQFRKEAYAE